MYCVLGLGLLLGAVIGQQDLSVRVQQLEAEVRELKHLEAKAIEFKKLETEVQELKQLIQHQQTHTDRRRRSVARPNWEHCPNGFARNDNSCYHVSHLLASWPEALVYCEAYGADLLAIESDQEQQFIAGHLKTIAGAGTYYWIAGTDAVTEGQWIWAKSAAPVSGYKNWAAGNPNNDAYNHPSHHQDCMALYNSGDNHKWDDGWCHDDQNFICEIELSAEPVNIVG